MNPIAREKQVARVFRTLRRDIDARQFYLRVTVQLDKALLGLLSKAVRVAEGVCFLVRGGYHEEALGLSRTCIDIFFTTRYICNKDSEARADSFLRFASVHVKNVSDVKKKFGHSTERTSEEHLALMDMANEFTNLHRWTKVWDMAVEPDPHFEERSDTGQPYDSKFDYLGIYEMLSHYVHGTAVSLVNHIQTGRRFTVHSGERTVGAAEKGSTAMLYAVGYVWMVCILVLRELGGGIPVALDRKLNAVVESLRADIGARALYRSPNLGSRKT